MIQQGLLRSNAIHQKTAFKRLNVFCFPYAGGSSVVFKSWSQSLPKDIEIVPVELPGHGSRLGEKLGLSIMEIVKRIGQKLINYSNTPFALFGHSMGALIAFELAHYLKEKYLPQPEHLLVSGHSAPHLAKRAENIHNLPDTEFLKKLGELNGTPNEVLKNTELMDLMMPILRADFQACETYSCGHSLPLDCPITAFGGRDDLDVSEKDLQSWRMHTSSRFRAFIVPGNHFFINSHKEPFLKIMTKELALIGNEAWRLA